MPVAAVYVTHDLHDHPLPPLAIELGVEDLLPRPEIQLAVGDRHDDLVPHDRALEVRVGIVFAGLVMRYGRPAGASFSSQTWKSSIRPSSQSLTYTPEVMCIADTSAMPSCTPLFLTIAATSSVMRMNSWRSLVLNQR